ncbi:MAG: biosynthetic peptidoglycan transglycosylase [Bacteroidales bacterium]
MYKKYLKVFIGILIIAFIILFFCRNIILRSVVDKKIEIAQNKFGLIIRYNTLHFNGLTTVGLAGLSVVPCNTDTLLTLKNINVRAGLFPLFIGRIVVKNIFLNGLSLNFIKKDSFANYDFLFKTRGRDSIEQNKNLSPDSNKVAEPINFSRNTNRILNLVYGLLPKNGELKNILITERKDSNFVKLSIPMFKINEGKFENSFFIEEDGARQELRTVGELNNSDNTLNVQVFSAAAKSVEVPYVNRRFGAVVSFDTLACNIVKTKDGSVLNLDGSAKLSGFNIYHKALSPQTVTLKRGAISYDIHIGENFIELDSSSLVQFNKLKFSPYIRADKNNGAWHFNAKINKEWFNSMDLFESLPSGLFDNLEGVKTKGLLAYKFFIDLDMARVDSLKLGQELKQKDFKIIDYGSGDLLKLNSEFVYTAYEKGVPVRSFAVGPSYEHFSPLDSISPVLQMSVLQSEDGEFFYHNGFRLDAIIDAIIHDIKERRFARGGSTISMQLIKNVFLNRNKNFARKAEEALLVWLIESRRLASKQRMFEVYLNIIEWGPGIYGAKEAAEFYFGKMPSQLTVEESIFMASIIPKPKYYLSSFDETGRLKANLQGYFSNIAKRLAKKELITQMQADTIRPQVKLKVIP